MTFDPAELVPVWEKLRQPDQLPQFRAAIWNRAAVTLRHREAARLLGEVPITAGWALRLGERPKLELLGPLALSKDSRNGFSWLESLLSRLGLLTRPADERPVLSAEAVLKERSALQVNQLQGGLVVVSALWAEGEELPRVLARQLGTAETRAVLVRDEWRPGQQGGTSLKILHEVAFVIAGPDAPGVSLRLEGLAQPWVARLREVTLHAGDRVP